MNIADDLRLQAQMIEEKPAYEGASPDMLRAAADEIERLQDTVRDITHYLDGWRARAQVSEALLTSMEKRR